MQLGLGTEMLIGAGVDAHEVYMQLSNFPKLSDGAECLIIRSSPQSIGNHLTTVQTPKGILLICYLPVCRMENIPSCYSASKSDKYAIRNYK